MKRWLIVTVEDEVEWPSEETTYQFLGHSLILRPPQGDSAADVRIQYEYPESESDAVETISRFLSALSWWQHRSARSQMHISCTAPIRGGKVRYGPPLRINYCIPPDVPHHLDTKAQIALALYREAGSVRGTAYEFLGYFKIINTRYARGDDQIAWINKTLPLLKDKDAIRRISDLSPSESDIGRYLYASGRCAVAHAFSDEVVDPDNPEDVIRLGSDMPVAKALAEYLIEHECGIKWEFSGRQVI